ncbi:MAG: hypothetical protein R2857_00750 [Vampirovibrionales bacterium]
MPVKGKGLADTVAERPKILIRPAKKNPAAGVAKKRKATDIPMPKWPPPTKRISRNSPTQPLQPLRPIPHRRPQRARYPQPSPQPTPQPGPLPQPVQPQPHPTAHNNQSPFRYDPVIKSTVPNANLPASYPNAPTGPRQCTGAPCTTVVLHFPTPAGQSITRP